MRRAFAQTLTATVRNLSSHAKMHAKLFTAFDDQTSTFIIPSGAGFEVIFCPGARSTNIIATSKNELVQLAQEGRTSSTAKLKRQVGPAEVFYITQVHHNETSIANFTVAFERSFAGPVRRASGFALLVALAALLAFFGGLVVP